MLREKLIETALQWQKHYGVAPQIRVNENVHYLHNNGTMTTEPN